VKGKRLAGSSQPQTSLHLSPKTTKKIFQKITRRSAEYAYLGYEPDDGVGESRSTKIQRPTESQLPSGVEPGNRPTDIMYSVHDISKTLNNQEAYGHRCGPRRVGENESGHIWKCARCIRDVLTAEPVNLLHPVPGCVACVQTREEIRVSNNGRLRARQDNI